MPDKFDAITPNCLPANIKIHALPPKGFDPTRSTPAMLRRYGLPQRPDDKISPELALRWDSLFSKNLNYVSPEFKLMEELLPAVRRQCGQVGGINKSTWSGSVIETAAADAFKSIAATFNVPDVAPAYNTTGTYWMVSLVGIDGYSSNHGCQVGTIQSVTINPNGAITKNCYAWAEWLPAACVGIANFPVNFGDIIAVLVCVNSPTQVYVNMINETTATHISFTYTAPVGIALKGYTAEWITERPGLNGNAPLLAEYGDVCFDTAVASSKSNKLFNAGNGKLLNVKENGYTVSDVTAEAPARIKLSGI